MGCWIGRRRVLPAHVRIKLQVVPLPIAVPAHRPARDVYPLFVRLPFDSDPGLNGRVVVGVRARIVVTEMHVVVEGDPGVRRPVEADLGVFASVRAIEVTLLQQIGRGSAVGNKGPRTAIRSG